MPKIIMAFIVVVLSYVMLQIVGQILQSIGTVVPDFTILSIIFGFDALKFSFPHWRANAIGSKTQRRN